MEYGRGMKLICLTLVLALSALTVWSGNGHARAAAAQTDLASLSTVLKMFNEDCGRYPTMAEGLDALIHRPPNVRPDTWHGPYLVARAQNPLDPWSHPYVYRCPGTHHTNSFDIYSCGPDGKSASGGDDPDDINNWNPSSPLVTRDVAEELPRSPAFYGVTIFLVLLALAWLERRILEPKGNLHGVFALLWVAAAPALWVVLVRMFGGGIMEYSLVIGFLGWLPLFLLWTISGYRRRTPLSKACAVITIPVLLLVILMMPL